MNFSNPFVMTIKFYTIRNMSLFLLLFVYGLPMAQETTFTNTHKLQGGATAIAIADFDKDDDVDVLSASVGDDSSRWYENDLRTLSEAEEKILEATVVQYPNPTSDTLYLRYPSASNVDYGLFDRNGRFLGAYSKTGKEHRFDVSGLSKGMYFLKATSDGVTYDYYRFLVN